MNISGKDKKHMMQDTLALLGHETRNCEGVTIAQTLVKAPLWVSYGQRNRVGEECGRVCTRRGLVGGGGGIQRCNGGWPVLKDQRTRSDGARSHGSTTPTATIPNPSGRTLTNAERLASHRIL